MIQITDAAYSSGFSSGLAGRPSAAAGVGVSRSPKRITITLPYETYQRLVQRSDNEGRSLSNLSAFLLESCVNRHPNL